jgi:hypothetical protein
MDIKTVISNILGRRIHKDRSKNALDPKAFPGQSNIYSPFRPYADQYTVGRHPVGINIMQKRNKEKGENQ